MKEFINFGFNKDRKNKHNRIIIITSWIIFLCTIGYNQMLQLYKYLEVKREFEELDTFIYDQKNDIKSQSKLNKNKLEKNLAHNTIYFNISDLFYTISKSLGPDIKFNNFKLNKSSQYIIIKGVTQSLLSLTKFIENLSQTPTLNNITLENIKEINNEDSTKIHNKHQFKELSFKIKFNILK